MSHHQHRRVGVGQLGQLGRRHHVQSPGAFTLAGDNNLARIPSVARDIQRRPGICWQRTQPRSLYLQQRSLLVGDDDLLLARDVPRAGHNLLGRVGIEGQREVKPWRQTGVGSEESRISTG